MVGNVSYYEGYVSKIGAIKMPKVVSESIRNDSVSIFIANERSFWCSF